MKGFDTMSSKIYGYCRISTIKQSIERQHRNILDLYPNAIIVDEVFTGTKVEGRRELNNKNHLPYNLIHFLN